MCSPKELLPNGKLHIVPAVTSCHFARLKRLELVHVPTWPTLAARCSHAARRLVGGANDVEEGALDAASASGGRRRPHSATICQERRSDDSADLSQAPSANFCAVYPTPLCEPWCSVCGTHALVLSPSAERRTLNTPDTPLLLVLLMRMLLLFHRHTTPGERDTHRRARRVVVVVVSPIRVGG